MSGLRILLLGFRPISISVTAEPKNAGKIANYAKGFLADPCSYRKINRYLLFLINGFLSLITYS